MGAAYFRPVAHRNAQGLPVFLLQHPERVEVDIVLRKSLAVLGDPRIDQQRSNFVALVRRDAADQPLAADLAEVLFGRRDQVLWGVGACENGVPLRGESLTVDPLE